jgi:hypothetical protein
MQLQCTFDDKINIGYGDQGLGYAITMYMWSFHYSHEKNQG